MGLEISGGYVNAYQAYNRGVVQVDKAAANIADLANENSQVDVNEEAVNLEQGQLIAKVGAKVLSVYDRTVGTLVDLEV